MVVVLLLRDQLVRDYEGYNPETASAERDLQGHGKRIFALKYHPENDETFVTGGWDNCLKVRNYRGDSALIYISSFCIYERI